MKRSNPLAEGFTLIEMLVALTLLAIMSVLSWQALDSTQRVTERTQRQHHDSMRLLSLLDQFEQDISQHALLTSPYPNAAGELYSPNAPALPAALEWRDNQLRIQQQDTKGQMYTITWRVHQQQLMRNQLTPARSRLQPTMHLDGVEHLHLRVWVTQRGWMALHEVPAGLRASGLELIIEARHQGQAVNYRKVVLLP